MHAVVAYALPVVLTGGRGAELTGRGGPSRALTMARLGLGEAVLRGSRGRLLPGGLAPWLNAPLIRALRGLAGQRPVLLLFGGEDDVQDQLARYDLDRLRASRSTSCRASATTSTIPTTSSASPRRWTFWLRKAVGDQE